MRQLTSARTVPEPTFSTISVLININDRSILSSRLLDDIQHRLFTITEPVDSTTPVAIDEDVTFADELVQRSSVCRLACIEGGGLTAGGQGELEYGDVSDCEVGG